jgi:O-methyltransferase
VLSGWLRNVARKLLREGSAPREGRPAAAEPPAPAWGPPPEPGRMTAEQAGQLLSALREAGYLPETYPAGGLPPVAPEQLDHVVHAMRLSGALSRLTSQQVENILYALRVAGHLEHLKDMRGAVYNDGYLISFLTADFLQDPAFAEAYRQGREADSWQGFDVRWRVHVLCWAANHGKRLGGDFVECGVNRGGNAAAVLHALDFANLTGRYFYLLDTYCGIPAEDRHLAMSAYLHSYRECYEEVRERFRRFPNARLVRGRVPDTLSQVPSEKVCFLSIDMNCAEPEIAAAEFFWGRLTPGAMVVLDDYACPGHQRQKEAFDQFARGKGVQVLTLPTGQGLMCKP